MVGAGHRSVIVETVGDVQKVEYERTSRGMDAHHEWGSTRRIVGESAQSTLR